jgi:alpha 1,6-mannosyltransferase
MEAKWAHQLLYGYRAFQSTENLYKAGLVATLLLVLYLWTRDPSPSRAFPAIPAPHFLDTADHLPHIPPYIWQIYIDYSPTAIEPYQGYIQSWVAYSPSYHYALLDASFADTLMSRLSCLPAHAQLVPIYYALTRRVMAGDFLRYLLLALQGRIYSDIDTSLLRPIKEWVPAQFRNGTKLVVGIEFDDREGKEMWKIQDEVQFCQWTLASAPGHPLMWTMVDGIAAAVTRLAKERNKPLAELEFSDRDVLDITGPTAWTAEVFRYMSRTVKRTVTWKDITGLKEPKLLGDILVLPINGFGTGQEHSGSVREVSKDALVQHHFKASWRMDGWAE